MRLAWMDNWNLGASVVEVGVIFRVQWLEETVDVNVCPEIVFTFVNELGIYLSSVCKQKNDW